MVQLLQNLADEFANFAQGMVRGNPLLRMNVRKHPALILRPSAHLQSSRRIRGGLNHHSFALARFFSKLLERLQARFRQVSGNTSGVLCDFALWLRRAKKSSTAELYGEAKFAASGSVLQSAPAASTVQRPP